MWPDLSVRPWRGVLAERLPRDDFYEMGGEDFLLEAAEARRLHELRGLFLAQVSEVEDLMIHVVDCVHDKRPDLIDGPHKKVVLSRALTIVRDVMKKLSADKVAESQFAMLYWMIARRNQLVHARVAVGYSQVGPDAPREPVIALLQEIQPGQNPVPWNDAPKLEECRNPGDFGWTGGGDEIGEYDLEVDLRRLYVCLDAAVDIYEVMRREPEPSS
jgi:hypothetical protein